MLSCSDHPARDRYAKLPDDFAPFVYRKQERDAEKPKNFWFFENSRQLDELVAKVKRNGYCDDLMTADGDSLLMTVVDRKLAHSRCEAIQAELARVLERLKRSDITESYLKGYSPLTRAHMLALILYTGCDCNYAMCTAERNGDYETWRWLSWLLKEAIRRLFRSDITPKPVAYSGEAQRSQEETRDRIFVHCRRNSESAREGEGRRHNFPRDAHEHQRGPRGSQRIRTGRMRGRPRVRAER